MSNVPGQLHGRRTPPGLELTILRRMPWMFVVGTLMPLALSVMVRLMPTSPVAWEAAKRVSTVDIFVIATIITVWTALATVSIGCVLVYIMKGPAYVADAYELNAADQPRPRSEHLRPGSRT